MCWRIILRLCSSGRSWITWAAVLGSAGLSIWCCHEPSKGTHFPRRAVASVSRVPAPSAASSVRSNAARMATGGVDACRARPVVPRAPDLAGISSKRIRPASTAFWIPIGLSASTIRAIPRRSRHLSTASALFILIPSRCSQWPQRAMRLAGKSVHAAPRPRAKHALIALPRRAKGNARSSTPRAAASDAPHPMARCSGGAAVLTGFAE
jgi:hypothetical protein